MEMLIWLVLAASAPAIVCVLSAAYLAYQQRSAWAWFLALSIGAEGAGIFTLRMINAHLLSAAG
jgi:hypothetical protein